MTSWRREKKRLRPVSGERGELGVRHHEIAPFERGGGPIKKRPFSGGGEKTRVLVPRKEAALESQRVSYLL